MVGKRTTVFDLIVLDRAGERVTLRITSAPLRANGEVVAFLGVGIPLGHVASRTDSALDDLTPRQHEVLRLLAEGLETREIAGRLGVADETARNHIRALLRTTGAHSRLEAVLLGLRHGMVTPNLPPGAERHQSPPAQG
jgi:DNA-binding CsgD family transcriptional regulator